MASSRWERLLDLRKVTLAEHLMTEAAKILAKDLEGWPPPVESIDAELGAAYAPLLAENAPRPPHAAILEGIRLARWDLQRDFEAFDDYVRNRRWSEHGLGDEQRDALLFVSRWLIEHLLALGEATEGRVKRPQMIDGLDQIQRRLLPS